MKHTPTPWRHHIGRGSNPKYHVQADGGFQIASTPGNEDWHQANAEHIVRCVNSLPDITAACDALLEKIAYIPGIEPERKHLINLLKAANPE